MRLVAVVIAVVFQVACSDGSGDPGPNDGGSGGFGGTGGGGGGGGDGGIGGGGSGGESAVHEIFGLDPDHGYVATRVKVIGEGLGSDASKVRVLFAAGRESAVLDLAEDGIFLETSVPSGAVTGPVSVLVDHGEGFVRVDGPVFSVDTDLPAGIIDSISPSYATEDVASEHRIHGSNFIYGSIAVIDGSDVSTQFISSSELKVTLRAENVPDPGEVPVVVRHPTGIVSEPASLEVLVPLDIVAGLWTSTTTMELDFSKPVDITTIHPDTTLSFSPTLLVLRITSADGRPETLALTTYINHLPDWEWSVEVKGDVRATDGAAIRVRTAEIAPVAP